MKIIFSSQDNKTINKNRDKYIFFAKPLLKDYYKILQQDIINNIFNNKNIDFQEHKEDLKNILKIVYKKIINTNYNSILNKNNIKVLDNKKSIEIDNLDDLKDISKNNLIEDLDEISEDRAFLIFDNLTKSINKLYNKINTNFNLDNFSLQQEITNTINILNNLKFSVNAPYINKEILQLEKRLNKLKQQLEERNTRKNTLLQSAFINEFKTSFINNKSQMQSQNEVDNFDGLIREKEFSFLNQMSNFILIESELKKQESLKEWENPMDEKSRITHAEANGQIVKENEKFAIRNPINNNIEYTDRPQGEGLSPENSINCRCTVKYFLSFES